MTRFRQLLLCLLMLALPLQGFAAAAMLYCGMAAGHQTTTAHIEVGPSHHEMANALGIHHDHKKPDADINTTHVSDSSGAQKKLPDSSHKCGICAACCNVMAVVNLPGTVDVQSLPKADLLEPVVQLYAVPPRHPEKPPRA